MVHQFLCFSFLFLALNPSVFAQDDDIQTRVDDRVSKMQAQLDLKGSQAAAIRPIIRDYLTRREAILQETTGEGGIADHIALKNVLRKLKEDEYQKLSKILTGDQMKKVIDKDNVTAALNPDGTESTVDAGDSSVSMGAGMNLKF